jgi:hypothetical protein
VGVHLDPEIEEDKGPAESPAEDVHCRGVVGREVEVGPGEARIGDKVAAPCQWTDQRGNVGS